MDMPLQPEFNQSMVQIKIEPGFERKEEKCGDLHIEMRTTIKAKVESGFDVKTEEFENFALADIKNESGFEANVEKFEDLAEESFTQLKTEKCEEMDAEFEILGAEAEDVVKNVTVIKIWMSCLPFRAVVEGSQFVPFKMPFYGSEVQHCPNEKRFHIVDLLLAFPNIGLIIDLANDRRTYRISDLMTFDVQYVNIPVQLERHNSVPEVQQLKQFIEISSIYSTMYPNKQIGVHDDQLGDRTSAYMICKALEQTGISVQLAMKRFQDARGYRIFPFMARVLNGSRRSWIPQSEFKPDVKSILKRKTTKQLKAQREANIGIKTQGPSQKQIKSAMKRLNAKSAANRHYQKFLASL